MTDVPPTFTRRRGRPRKNPRPDQESENFILTDSENQETDAVEAPRPTRAQKERAARRRRGTTDGARDLKLVPSIELDRANFEYRWINDVGMRVHGCTVQDDWDVVTDEDARPVTAAGDKAYLVRKPKEFYDEDARQKSARVNRELESIQGAPAQSGGDIARQAQQSGGFYRPDR